MARRKLAVLTESPLEEAQGEAGDHVAVPQRRQDGTLTPELARELRREQVEARRARQAAEEGTLTDKVRHAIDSLSQAKVTAMVEALTQSATGAQALLRLIEYVERKPEEEGEGEGLSPADRAAIYDALLAGAIAPPARPPSTTPR